LENPEVTPKYTELVEGLTKAEPEAGDILVSVDVASPRMVQKNFEQLADKITLRIDHHKNEEPWTEHELVDPISAACGQIIYWVFLQLGISLDIPMANALYTAVATDTGCFRYANAQAQTYETAAACARVTPYLRELNHNLFETNSLARLRIQGWMVENARFLHDGKVCLCPIPLEVEQRIGVTEDDMENISGFPRSIAGVKIAATFRQENERKVKISVRVDLDYDAAVICAKLGGGGHRGAAGASLEMSMEDAVNAFIAALPEME
jgi:phosphoesterase RecJ-like protein